MIRGYCIGGGMALATCCDMRIATPGSKFGIPAAKLGLGYDSQGHTRLMSGGPSFAKEIFFTARQFDAEEARMMGFVNRVVPDGELETYVKNYAGDDRRQCAAHHRRGQVRDWRIAEGRDGARHQTAAAGQSSAASTARIISRAAPPSWKSASRPSPGNKKRLSSAVGTGHSRWPPSAQSCYEANASAQSVTLRWPRAARPSKAAKTRPRISIRGCADFISGTRLRGLVARHLRRRANILRMRGKHMYTDLQLYIDGEWLNGTDRKSEDVINPATGKVAGTAAARLEGRSRPRARRRRQGPRGLARDDRL